MRKKTELGLRNNITSYRPYRDYRGRFASRPYYTILTGKSGWQMFDKAIKDKITKRQSEDDTKNI